MTLSDPRDDPNYQVGGDKFRAQFESVSDAIPAKAVNDFHRKADTDSSQQAIHHTLGTKQDQASPGAHNHNGDNSNLIMKGMTITGAKAGNAALASVIAQLVKLGATDTST